MPKFDPITRYQMHYVLCRLYGLKPLSPSEFLIMELASVIKKVTAAVDKLAVVFKEAKDAISDRE